MRKLAGRPERQQGDETMQPPTRPAPSIARITSTEFCRRHITRVPIARLVVAIAAVTLGSIFCVSGHWWGALLFIPALLFHDSASPEIYTLSLLDAHPTPS